MGYQIGDIVERAFPLKYPEDRKKRVNRVIRLAASLAACICVAVFGVYEYQYFFLPYGTIQMQINPDVEMTLSRSGRVLDLYGINEDGNTLIDGYDYEGKDEYTVTDELTDRAIDLGFLDDGGQVALLVISKNTEWADTLEKDLVDELNEHLKQYDLTINVSVGTIDADILEEPQSITIPIPDPEPAPEPAAEPEPVQPAAGDSGYDDDASDDLYEDAGDDTDDGDSSYGDDDWDDGDDSGEDVDD